jgi:hypothetical protein
MLKGSTPASWQTGDATTPRPPSPFGCGTITNAVCCHGNRRKENAMTKTEKEKGEGILRKRKRAQQGLKPEVEENADPIAEEGDRERKIAASAAVGLGLKRSG